MREIDEGFEDVKDKVLITNLPLQQDPVQLTIAPPEDSEDEEEKTEEASDDDDTALDASGIPGWDRVDSVSGWLVCEQHTGKVYT